MKTIFKNAITCSTDYNYVKYLYPFLDSLINVNIKADIFVRVVDFTTEQLLEIKSKYKNINIIEDHPMMSEKKTLLKTSDKMILNNVYKIKNILDIKKVLYSPRSFYTCHSRFLSIYELLKKNYNVLSLDVDTIALKNFDDVFNLKNDILTVKSESNNDIFSNEGFLLFKNTEINKTYIHKIVNYIFTEKNFIDWNADHYALHKFKPNNVNVYLLDEKYKDRKHLNNSIMWTGDANNKYNEKFTLHMEK
jgi:hypothetical protein